MELFGFLPIDKPLGWTSHDVVARLRRITGTRRVGHAGTLDPAATGVLVAGVGRATRFLDYVQDSTKEYVAHIVFGVSSVTADVDGRLGEVGHSGPPPDNESIREALKTFTGEIDQVPPKYSAVKQGGEPLYRRVRRGEVVDVPVRRVRVDQLQMIHYSYPDLILSIQCGPGVYIRSLAEDLAANLGCDGYLHHLLRTRVGIFGLEQCWGLEQLGERLNQNRWTNLATAPDLAAALLPAVWLSSKDEVAWYHGRSVRTGEPENDPVETVRALTNAGEFAGLGAIESFGDGSLDVRPRIVLATS